MPSDLVLHADTVRKSWRRFAEHRLVAFSGLDAQHGRRILLAESDDGLRWHRLFETPVLASREASSRNDKGVAVTRIVARDGAL